RYRVRVERGPKVWMPRAMALGDQDLDLLPEQLLTRIAKDLLDLRIDKFDLSLFVNNDHGVWRRFEQPADAFLRLLPLRDVANEGVEGVARSRLYGANDQ